MTRTRVSGEKFSHKVFRFIIKLLCPKMVRAYERRAALAARLWRDEATMAHNEITYDVFQGVIPYWLHTMPASMNSVTFPHQDIEIAAFLYDRIMRIRGTPITFKQAMRYRLGLRFAMWRILRDGTTDFDRRTKRAAKWLAPYLLERSKVMLDDCSNLADVLFEMRRAGSRHAYKSSKPPRRFSR